MARVKPGKALILIAGVVSSLLFFFAVSNGIGIVNSLVFAVFLPPGFVLIGIPVIFILVVVGLMLLEMMLGLLAVVRKLFVWVKKSIGVQSGGI